MPLSNRGASNPIILWMKTGEGRERKSARIRASVVCPMTVGNGNDIKREKRADSDSEGPERSSAAKVKK